ncbi:hypothetical protein HEP87_48010 [Streptomyces sp. S1D4-11]|nr:hypothetical protein [Streptomyces sp. S1D4-11]QIZ00177.1 hypothetical protein HEP87_48010 [Streptomyces sp. S1D4-11]
MPDSEGHPDVEEMDLGAVDYGNSRKVMLRRAELESRYPGLLDLVRTRTSTHA